MAAQHRNLGHSRINGARLKPFYSTHQGPLPAPSLTTAREKHRSVTAEDAAQAVADAERSVKTQQQRMHQHQQQAPVSSFKAGVTSSGRGNKTLGWFMDDIFDKKTGSVSMKSDAVVPASSKPSDEKKRRRGGRRGGKKPHTAEAATPALSDGTASVASEEFIDDKLNFVLPELPREDFWMYDVASDGYYYEQNGAKGWRRRMPNSAMQKIKEQEMAHLAANNGKIPSSSAPSTLSSQQQQQAAAAQAMLLQTALFNQPIKYYDPSSDGFFYEMASVDGWKRRQPAAAASSRPVPQQARSSAMMPQPTSYGAALARGQMPRNCVNDSSASSSVSEETLAQDPFGLDSGFQMATDGPFISRPQSLEGRNNAQMRPDFNADNFIRDLSFSGMDPHKVLGPCSRTPSDAWSIHCGGWSQPQEPIQSQSPEEDAMGLLLKGLENIWANPTPVKK